MSTALVHRHHFRQLDMALCPELAQYFDAEEIRARIDAAIPYCEESLRDLADRWMHTNGGRHVMRDLFALAAKFVPRWRRTGIPVSVALLWETERQRIKEVSARACRMGYRIKDEFGYTLNNSYRAYVARHIMDRRQDWKGLFEIREVKS